MLLYNFTDEQEALSITNFLSANLDISTVMILVADKFLDYNFGSASYLFKVRGEEQYMIVTRDAFTDYDNQGSATIIGGWTPKASMIDGIDSFIQYFPDADVNDIKQIINDTDVYALKINTIDEI